MNGGPGEVVVIRAAAVCEPSGVVHRPGAVMAEAGRAVAWGEADAVLKQYGEAAVIDRPGELLLPGLVNAHAHLELTAIGPQPYGGDFVGWITMLREHWPGDEDPWSKLPDEAWFTEAAREGAAQSCAAGVERVGDITRSASVVSAQRDAGLAGVGYRELFGLGPPWDAEALAAVNEGDTLVEGWQPHAPYSTGPAVYAAAADSGRLVCTHLAETLEEACFVAEGGGPFHDFVRGMDKLGESFGADYGQGLSPVRWMEPYLRRTPWLVAHCNYVSDDDIALLAQTGASVAYCPVASAYFGHQNHRYRDMLGAGVNVCLGTDSIVCQPPDEPQPLGVLPQMRFLHRRDGTDPALLLRMATAHGRRALQMDDTVTMLAAVRIDPDDATDPLTQALRRNDPAEGIPLSSPHE